ncbi:unnamed protein product [Schistosoma mattheei]|uniref:Uncharacterized protein n=1 Tax=Schistosoma mattheei TaxID=31246 RepID=A0A3P8GZE1_9TREM|nr:unnamed protein product [Schistosoma mattheei]
MSFVRYLLNRLNNNNHNNYYYYYYYSCYWRY